MLRKITAIALISILTCSQFGKILGYIGCSVYNMASSNATCDCQKEFHNAKGNDIQSVPGKITVKEKTEEIFTPYSAVLTGNRACRNSGPKLIPGKSHLPVGFLHAIFQPPKD